MKNSDYWKLRFEQLEKAQNNIAKGGRSEIDRLYREAVKDIEGKINTWYQRLAANNGVSMAEARKLLNASELAEFKWDVHDYIKYGQDNVLNGQWAKQLENASAKFHISKYEALKIQTQQSLESLFAKQLGVTSKTMKEAYLSGYYHTAFEIQKGFGVGRDISGIDQSQIEKVISKPWAADGYNFSERIWNNKQKLISEVHNELTQSIITGADPQKAINNIAKKMNASKSNAGRLVMTESAYFSSAAQKDCFDDLGVEEYEIVATLDAHTSEICQSMDGKHFPLKDFQAGVTAPPFHPWCRSTTCPYFDDDYGEVGERAARGGDGKTYFVPADMNYREWKETFVDGGDKEVLAAIDKSENGGIINVGSDNVTSKSWFEEKNSIDFNDEQSVTKALLNFEDMYANSDREHCIVISTSGKVYEVHGEKWAVDTSVLGYELKGSINEHNHVFGESHYSFSREDLFSSIDDGSAIVYAFDEKYRYMMDFRDTDISEEQVHIAYRAAVEEVNEIKFFEYISGNITLNFDNEQHEIIKRTCERLGVVYERHEK